MRKLISILLIAGLLFVCGNSYATMNRFNQGQTIKVYAIANTSRTGSASAIVATTTISPTMNRIIGYTVQLLNTSYAGECVAGLYDTGTDAGCTTGASGTMFAESEALAAGYEETVWFPYPKSLSTSLWIRQGANTLVTIYYEDYYGV